MPCYRFKSWSIDNATGELLLKVDKDFTKTNRAGYLKGLPGIKVDLKRCEAVLKEWGGE